MRPNGLNMLTPVAVLLAAWLLSSCIYDYSDCDALQKTRIKLLVDWDMAPGASPAGLAACFFPIGEGEIWRFDLPSPNGGNISLPPGKYRMLLFNNDTSDVFFKDVDSYMDYDAYTLPVGDSNYADGNEAQLVDGEPVLDCPDMMWRAVLSDVEVSEHGVSYDNSTFADTVVCHPDELCAHYHFRINDITNLDDVRKMAVILSGMSGSVRIASMDLDSNPVVLPVDMRRAGADAVSGEFVTFGRCDDLSVNNMLTLSVRLSDGSRHKFVFDVTGQIFSAADPYDVYIEVSGVDLPDVIPDKGDESTLDVEVVDWSTTYIELESEV